MFRLKRVKFYLNDLYGLSQRTDSKYNVTTALNSTRYNINLTEPLKDVVGFYVRDFRVYPLNPDNVSDSPTFEFTLKSDLAKVREISYNAAKPDYVICVAYKRPYTLQQEFSYYKGSDKHSPEAQSQNSHYIQNFWLELYRDTIPILDTFFKQEWMTYIELEFLVINPFINEQSTNY